MVAAAVLLVGAQACGSSTNATHATEGDGGGEAGGDAGADAGGNDGAPTGNDSGGIDSGIGPTGPCGWSGLNGLDASCGVGADCHPGQVCLVAEGCFCAPQGRCIDSPCDAGLSSPSCASTTCNQALSGNADPDAGTITCFVEGC